MIQISRTIQSLMITLVILKLLALFQVVIDLSNVPFALTVDCRDILSPSVTNFMVIHFDTSLQLSLMVLNHMVIRMLLLLLLQSSFSLDLFLFLKNNINNNMVNNSSLISSGTNAESERTKR
ncbi:unnamed protein product [Arabidopsis halleri]